MCNSMRGLSDFAHQQNQQWSESKQRLLNDVKGTSEAKVVRLIFNQHEVCSFDFSPLGFANEETGETFKYRITYKDFDSLGNEYPEPPFKCQPTTYQPAKLHTMFFSKLPI